MGADFRYQVYGKIKRTRSSQQVGKDRIRGVPVATDDKVGFSRHQKGLGEQVGLNVFQPVWFGCRRQLTKLFNRTGIGSRQAGYLGKRYRASIYLKSADLQVYTIFIRSRHNKPSCGLPGSIRYSFKRTGIQRAGQVEVFGRAGVLKDREAHILANGSI